MRAVWMAWMRGFLYEHTTRKRQTTPRHIPFQRWARSLVVARPRFRGQAWLSADGRCLHETGTDVGVSHDYPRGHGKEVRTLVGLVQPCGHLLVCRHDGTNSSSLQALSDDPSISRISRATYSWRIWEKILVSTVQDQAI